MDIEGNVYKTIKIGTQTWMAENLRTTRFQDHDQLGFIKDSTEWKTYNTAAFCNYNNTDNEDTIATYGRLYNSWAARDYRNIAPKGWHVPTISEFMTLFKYLGGYNIAGYKMKEAGNLHWELPSDNNDNSSGFTALPGGWTYENQEYVGMGSFANYWTRSESAGSDDGVFVYMYSPLGDIYIRYNPYSCGYAIRCIKD